MTALSKHLMFGVFMLNISIAFGQTKDHFNLDSIIKKMDYYSKKKNDGILFAHFDKTIYANGETVWFTAYLLNAINSTDKGLISAFVVNDHTRSIILEKKFLMATGFSFGKLILPDTVPVGDYSVILYDNKIHNGVPDNVFIQPIIIKSSRKDTIEASLILIDSGKYIYNRKRTIKLITKLSGDKIVSGAIVNYYVGDKSNPILKGDVKTDKTGQCTFEVSTQNLTTDNNLLKVQIKYDNKLKELKLVIPVVEDSIVVKFYPEGGGLSDGLLSTIGWEAKSEFGSPYNGLAVLYKDDMQVDSMSANSYGMGHFELKPDAKSRYYVKLPGARKKETIYELPQPYADRPVITAINAITNDTLNVTIKNKHPAKFIVNIHNFKQLFSSVPIDVDANGKILRIDLTDLPKGISEITILDSLNRPCAERLFFAHYNRRNKLEIVTDKPIYKSRNKVLLNLKLQNANGRADHGYVSIACVQANRLSINKVNNIDSYLYLYRQLGALPVKQNYMDTIYEEKQFLEDLLLIKGWRNYSWEEMSDAKVIDTLRKIDALNFDGKITYLGRSLKKAIPFFLIKDTSLIVLATDNEGKFNLGIDNLLTSANKKIRLLVNGLNPQNYEFKMNDPYGKINNELSKSFIPRYNSHSSITEYNEKLKELDHVINLREVNIKVSKDDSFYQFASKNECGDFVCPYGYLNCPLHIDNAGNKAPIKGRIYKHYLGTSNGVDSSSPVRYEGCVDKSQHNEQIINGIYYSEEFYPANYAKENRQEPELQSTVYWRHLYKISEQDNTPIEFYTSDITGDFKIVVQGIGGNDVIYGEKTIGVSNLSDH